MKRPYSISLRLTLVVSLAVFVGGLATWPLLVWASFLVNPNGELNPDDLALHHAQYVVTESLRRASSGSPHVEPTPALQRYAANNPGFRFAVFEAESGSAIPGSDAQLVAAIKSERFVHGASLRVSGDAEPHAHWRISPFRSLTITRHSAIRRQ